MTLVLRTSDSPGSDLGSENKIGGYIKYLNEKSCRIGDEYQQRLGTGQAEDLLYSLQEVKAHVDSLDSNGQDHPVKSSPINKRLDECNQINIRLDELIQGIGSQLTPRSTPHHFTGWADADSNAYRDAVCSKLVERLTHQASNETVFNRQKCRLKEFWDWQTKSRRPDLILKKDGIFESWDNHVAKMKDRLARNNVNEAFKFHLNPQEQDGPTTWIEYIHYEAWWLEWYESTVRNLQPLYENALIELADCIKAKSFDWPLASSIVETWQERKALEELCQWRVDLAERVLEPVKNPTTILYCKDEKLQHFWKYAVQGVRGAQDLQWQAMQLEPIVSSREDPYIAQFLSKTQSYRDVVEQLRLQNLFMEWLKSQIPQFKTEPDPLPSKLGPLPSKL